jgi:DNA-binding CsgD family transcriptional regulator
MVLTLRRARGYVLGLGGTTIIGAAEQWRPSPEDMTNDLWTPGPGRVRISRKKGAPVSRQRKRVIGPTGGAVSAISAADAERLLRFLSDTEELCGDDPFPPPVLEQLGTLIPAEWIGFEERDFVGRRCLAQYEHSDDSTLVGGIEFDLREDPLVRYLLDGHFDAIRLSDLLPRRALQRTHYYGHVLAPQGITDSLGVAIPSPSSHSKRFILDRHGGYFSKRDRTVLQYLRPHFGRLWRAAQTRRRLRAATAGLAWASEQDRRGVLLLAPDGRVEFASPPARRLMREYFGARHKADLPIALREWLESGAPTLRLRLDDRHITVGRSGDALLLEEAGDDFGLSSREREILAWLARGKTNPEIAEALWIAPTTVRKHLESIYAKLGVGTRAAAVARFLGAGA